MVWSVCPKSFENHNNHYLSTTLSKTIGSIVFRWSSAFGCQVVYQALLWQSSGPPPNCNLNHQVFSRALLTCSWLSLNNFKWGTAFRFLTVSMASQGLGIEYCSSIFVYVSQHVVINFDRQIFLLKCMDMSQSVDSTSFYNKKSKLKVCNMFLINIFYG